MALRKLWGDTRIEIDSVLLSHRALKVSLLPTAPSQQSAAASCDMPRMATEQPTPMGGLDPIPTKSRGR